MASQQELAPLLGASLRTVRRWIPQLVAGQLIDEDDSQLPTLRYDVEQVQAVWPDRFKYVGAIRCAKLLKLPTKVYDVVQAYASWPDGTGEQLARALTRAEHPASTRTAQRWLKWMRDCEPKNVSSLQN